jgi:hypothetical protein
VCQRLGIGSKLLEELYGFYLRDKRCTEITVEDPSDDFQQMKDALDIKLIWQAGFFMSIRALFPAKKGSVSKQTPGKMMAAVRKSVVTRDNFEAIMLDQEEIQ